MQLSRCCCCCLTDGDVRCRAFQLLTLCFIVVCVTVAEDASVHQLDEKGPPRLIASRYVRRHSVRPGDRLRLFCPVEASPHALVAWLKDGEAVRLGWDRYRVRLDDSSLTVRDLQMDDTGVFTCRATNGFGSIDVTYLVYVSLDGNSALPADFDEEFFQEMHQKGVTPMFTRLEQMTSSSHVTVHRGETVRLRCQAVGRPRVQVLWFKDGKMLSTPGEQAAAAAGGVGGGSDAGVRAVTPGAGPVAAAAAAGDDAIDSEDDYYYYDDNDEEDIDVSVRRSRRQSQQQQRQMRSVNDRRSPQLQQQSRGTAPGKPAGTASGTGVRRNSSREHSTSSRISISMAGRASGVDVGRLVAEQHVESEEEERLSLKLNDVTPNDAGRYSCRVFNKAGSINFTYTLQVVEPKVLKPTIISPFPENTTVPVSATVTFRCYISSNSVPRVQWLKLARSDDVVSLTSLRSGVTTGQYVLLQSSDVTPTSADDVFESRLTLNDVTEQSAGIYMCSLATPSGEVFSAHAVLTVLAGDVRQARQDMAAVDLSFIIVGIVATSCCLATVATLGAVCVIMRHRRRQRLRHPPKGEGVTMANHQCMAPLITSFRLPPRPSPYPCLPPPPPPQMRAPLPDVTKYSDDNYEHHYDVLETNSCCAGGGGNASSLRDVTAYYCRPPVTSYFVGGVRESQSARCSAALSRTSLHSSLSHCGGSGGHVYRDRC